MMKQFTLWTMAFLCLVQTATAQTFRWDDPKASAEAAAPKPVDHETGIANRYPDYHEGNTTALGEIFRHSEMTAAHPKLPLGTIVQVTRIDNGQSVRVRINDRGAYCDACIIDLSRTAADALGLSTNGSTRVRLTPMGTSQQNPPAPTVAAVNPDMAPANPVQFTARGITGQQPAAYAAEQVADDEAEEYDDIYVEIIIPACPPSAQLPEQQTRGAASATPTTTDNHVTVIEVPISPYTVQFGAYAQLPNAKRHIQTLRAKGFDNIFLLQDRDDSGALLHRVVAAPFAQRTEADAYVQELAQHHQIKGLVFRAKLEEVK